MVTLWSCLKLIYFLTRQNEEFQCSHLWKIVVSKGFTSHACLKTTLTLKKKKNGSTSCLGTKLEAKLLRKTQLDPEI